MSTYTTRNDLIKPDYTDAADIKDLNDNFDFIDGSIAPCEWAKTSAPTVNDDITLGYIVGSLWFDTTNHKLYICESNTDGAALWRLLYPQSQSGVLLADGTVPLTAAWDAGSYQIRAETFQSDVATGTAPLTVASATKVTNLNADDVDGYDATEFAILAGQSGGQTLYGGTAASNNLTLYGSSHATQGVVKIPQGGLEIGTKATTATYGAINIHEGASGATNEIVFLDGDGSTTASQIYKTSTDCLVLSGGGLGYGPYIDTTGKIVTTYGIEASMNSTDAVPSSNIALTMRPVTATGGTTTFYGVYDAIFPELRTGKTESGAIYAYYTECMRNHNAAATDDDGTLGYLIGLRSAYGHYSLNTSMKGVTTNVYGLYLTPYCQKGTITNFYGVYIATPATGGTMTNQWPFYSGWNAQHYFGGDIYTVGNCSALSFTDRTPGYDGDARAELRKGK